MTSKECGQRFLRDINRYRVAMIGKPYGKRVTLYMDINYMLEGLYRRGQVTYRMSDFLRRRLQSIKPVM